MYHSNIITQTLSTISVCPVGLSIYKRIQKYDIIRVLGGMFADMVGFVNDVYHGTGWYVVKTASHSLRLYRTSMELEDRLCVQDFVRITARGPFLGKQGTVRKVDAEGNVEVATIYSHVSQTSLAHLVFTKPYFFNNRVSFTFPLTKLNGKSKRKGDFRWQKKIQPLTNASRSSRDL